MREGEKQPINCVLSCLSRKTCYSWKPAFACWKTAIIFQRSRLSCNSFFYVFPVGRHISATPHYFCLPEILNCVFRLRFLYEPRLRTYYVSAIYCKAFRELLVLHHPLFDRVFKPNRNTLSLLKSSIWNGSGLSFNKEFWTKNRNTWDKTVWNVCSFSKRKQL